MKKIKLAFVTLALSTLAVSAQDIPEVVNPVTGEVIAVDQIAPTTLTQEQIEDVRAQVAAIREEQKSTMEQTRERSQDRAGEMGEASEGHGGGAGGPGGGNGPGRP